MHIAFVTTTYPPETGWSGIGSYVYHMARGLQAAGHSVSVLCGYAAQPSDRMEDGIHVVRSLSTTSPVPVTVQVLQKLEALIEEDHIDVVEFPEHDAPGIGFQRRHPEFPTVVRLHGDSELCFMGRAPLWKRMVARLYWPKAMQGWIDLQRETVRRAHLAVAPSHWALRQWHRRGWILPPLTGVVPNPFSGWTGDDFTARAGRYQDNKVLWLGRLDRLKGIHLLPAIARSLWRLHPEAEIHVIGQSPSGQEQDIRRRILRRIHPRHHRKLLFLGGIPYADLLPMLQQYSVAVFASTWETFSYTQLECMWAGIACVSASGSGAAELGRNGEHVLNCRRRPAGIARQLALLLGDTAYRELLGRAAREHVRDRFDSLRVARAMAPLYAQACCFERQRQETSTATLKQFC